MIMRIIVIIKREIIYVEQMDTYINWAKVFPGVEVNVVGLLFQPI